jgi:hypothetical protein
MGVELHYKNEKRGMLARLTCAVRDDVLFSGEATEGEK